MYESVLKIFYVPNGTNIETKGVVLEHYYNEDADSYASPAIYQKIASILYIFCSLQQIISSSVIAKLALQVFRHILFRLHR